MLRLCRRLSRLSCGNAFDQPASLVGAGLRNFVRGLSTETTSNLFRFCVVGSGPAGFYTAERERLPTPFGLVRSGVAPDHADTKNVINQYTTTAGDSRLSYFGNVTVGRDVSVQELQNIYSAVVLAYGADSDRKLNVPGEDLQGVFSAREFVQWYNGHPDNVALPVDLSQVRSVAVCGLGNVAVDCARVLLRSPDVLAGTDMSSHALEQLRHSAVQQVHLLGRRGPIQAAFTAKELRELLGLPAVEVHIREEDLAVSPEDEAEMKAVRLKRRIHEILSKAASTPKDSTSKSLYVHFFRNPVELQPDAQRPGHVGTLRCEITQLMVDESGSRRARGTGQFEDIPAQLILKSIGYKSVPMEGVPFDAQQGIVPNMAGRVEATSAAGPGGLYVCGWLKRGPSGIIGTNLADAQETVATIAADVASQGAPACKDGVADQAASQLGKLLQTRGVQWVDFQQWQSLDAHEVARGEQVGKPREKVTAVDDMLAVCHGQ